MSQICTPLDYRITKGSEKLQHVYCLKGACRTYGGQKRHIQDFGGETSGKETTRKAKA